MPPRRALAPFQVERDVRPAIAERGEAGLRVRDRDRADRAGTARGISRDQQRFLVRLVARDAIGPGADRRLACGVGAGADEFGQDLWQVREGGGGGDADRILALGGDLGPGQVARIGPGHAEHVAPIERGADRGQHMLGGAAQPVMERGARPDREAPGAAIRPHVPMAEQAGQHLPVLPVAQRLEGEGAEREDRRVVGDAPKRGQMDAFESEADHPPPIPAAVESGRADCRPARCGRSCPPQRRPEAPCRAPSSNRT